MSFKNEQIIENKTCQHCQVSFDITDKDLEFYEKVSPVFSGKKYSIPTPKLCPDCRQQRRLSFRNERKLYKRKCDATGEDIISIYSPDKSYKVYHCDYWWSDKWDAMDYGVDFDFEKSFFEQFEVLIKGCPFPNTLGMNNENSEYTNLVADNKNCYLVFESSNNEDCLYCYWIQKCKNCTDVSFSHECVDCSDIDNCFDCYNLKNSTDCRDCSNSWFLENCMNCSYCYGCVNLQNKQYYIFNEQKTKEEYQEFIKNKKTDAYYSGIIKELFLQSPKKYSKLSQAENSSGCYLNNVKDCIECYHGYDAENCKYSEHIWRNTKDVMDVSTVGRDAELVYESINTAIGVYKDLFDNVVWSSTDVLYSFYSTGSSNLFGCVGLKDKQYCIFNKQYTKEEYNILVPKIIEHMRTTGEWGEFFPSSISPFGYNETVAQEYFPLKKSDLTPNPSPLEERGVAQSFISPSLQGRGPGGGFNWSDYEAPFPKVEKIIPADKLPDTIGDIPDDILNWAIECEVTRKPFRIIQQELTFYRKHNLPIPRKHPDQRHLERMQLRNPNKLYKRGCDTCSIEMDTTYAPERKEKIYCEECYKKEVY